MGKEYLKGHFCSQIDFFILDPISWHNSKTPHVFRIPGFDLKPAQILENVPSPVLTTLPTGIGEFDITYIHINYAYLYCRHSEIAHRYCQNHLPLLAKSPSGIDEIIYQGNELAIWPIPVGNLVNTGWCFGQYRLANWPIPVGDFGVAAIRICIIYMYVLSNPSIPVGELANTG